MARDITRRIEGYNKVGLAFAGWSLIGRDGYIQIVLNDGPGQVEHLYVGILDAGGITNASVNYIYIAIDGVVLFNLSAYLLMAGQTGEFLGPFGFLHGPASNQCVCGYLTKLDYLSSIDLRFYNTVSSAPSYMWIHAKSRSLD